MRRAPLCLSRAVYREARRRWIAGERETLLSWLQVAIARPTLAASTVAAYARRQGWPRRHTVSVR